MCEIRYLRCYLRAESSGCMHRVRRCDGALQQALTIQGAKTSTHTTGPRARPASAGLPWPENPDYHTRPTSASPAHTRMLASLAVGRCLNTCCRARMTYPVYALALAVCHPATALRRASLPPTDPPSYGRILAPCLTCRLCSRRLRLACVCCQAPRRVAHIAWSARRRQTPSARSSTSTKWCATHTHTHTHTRTHLSSPAWSRLGALFFLSTPPLAPRPRPPLALPPPPHIHRHLPSSHPPTLASRVCAVIIDSQER